MDFRVDFQFDLDEALAPTAKATTSSSSSSSDDYSNEKKLAFSEMPTVRVGGDTVCCVCMESFVLPDINGPGCDHHGNGKQLPCGHVYHPDCILVWISSCNNSCPLCRHVLFSG